MINIKEVNNLVKRDITKLEDKIIVIKSFKKDRIVSIYLEDNNIIVKEEGFKHINHKFDQNDKQTIKQIKKIINEEFPRSNKLWYSIKNK